MPGEEPVDKLPQLTEDCKPGCAAQWAKYQECIPKLATNQGADCEPWYFDYMKCLDKCRVPKMFAGLK